MKSIKKQSGAVLIVGLIMVMVLSVVVIASSRTTVMQLKMTSNQRDAELAFQAAESALMTAENYIKETDLESIVFDVDAGFHNYNISRDLSKDSGWVGLSTIESSQSNPQVAQKPTYIIEHITGIKPLGNSSQAGLPVDNAYYRVTALSKGGTESSVAVLQTVYKK